MEGPGGWAAWEGTCWTSRERVADFVTDGDVDVSAMHRWRRGHWSIGEA